MAKPLHPLDPTLVSNCFDGWQPWNGYFDYGGKMYAMDTWFYSVSGAYFPVIFQSSDQGTTWTKIVDSGFSGAPVTTAPNGYFSELDYWHAPTNQLLFTRQNANNASDPLTLWAWNAATNTFSEFPAGATTPPVRGTMPPGVSNRFWVQYLYRHGNHIYVFYERWTTHAYPYEQRLHAAHYEIGVGWVAIDVEISTTSFTPGVNEGLQTQIFMAWADANYVNIAYASLEMDALYHTSTILHCRRLDHGTLAPQTDSILSSPEFYDLEPSSQREYNGRMYVGCRGQAPAGSDATLATALLSMGPLGSGTPSFSFEWVSIFYADYCGPEYMHLAVVDGNWMVCGSAQKVNVADYGVYWTRPQSGTTWSTYQELFFNNSTDYPALSRRQIYGTWITSGTNAILSLAFSGWEHTAAYVPGGIGPAARYRAL